MSIEIKELGLVVHGPVQTSELQAVLSKLATSRTATTWQLADIFGLYEDAAEDKVAIRNWLAAGLHMCYTHVQVMARVARMIPINIRRAEYSFAVHRYACQLGEPVTKDNITRLLKQAADGDQAARLERRRRGHKHAIVAGKVPDTLRYLGKSEADYKEALRNIPFDKICGIIESATKIFRDKKASASDYTDEQKARLKTAYETIYAKYTELVAEQCTRQIF